MEIAAALDWDCFGAPVEVGFDGEPLICRDAVGDGDGTIKDINTPHQNFIKTWQNRTPPFRSWRIHIPGASLGALETAQKRRRKI